MDDIVTTLVNADIDGERLASDEFGFFVLLLAVAGNETTRNAITHGMHAFLDHPDQWELYKARAPARPRPTRSSAGPPRSSSSSAPPRTTPCSAAQQIKKGQRVGMFYGSANFDEDVFDRPATASTSSATPTRTSASAAAARTSASAPTWPGWRST